MPPPRLPLLTLPFLLLLLASTPSPSLATPDARLVHLPRRHPSPPLVPVHLLPRQGLFPSFGGGGANDATSASTPTAPATSDPAAATTPATPSSSSRGGLDLLTELLPPTSSSAPPSSSSVDSRTSSSSSRLTVVTSTSTSGSSIATLPPLASASGSAETQKNNDSGGGGIGKGTLIAVIVIASCVGGVAAIWTVIRKWKFSPSKRFEDKLQPIDFGPLGKKGGGGGEGLETSSQVNLMATSDKLNRSNSGKTEQSDSYHRHEPSAWQTPYMTPHHPIQHQHQHQLPYGHGPPPTMQQPYGAGAGAGGGYGAAGYGADAYYPPPAAPYASQPLGRGDSWRTGPGRY